MSSRRFSVYMDDLSNELNSMIDGNVGSNLINLDIGQKVYSAYESFFYFDFICTQEGCQLPIKDVHLCFLCQDTSLPISTNLNTC